MNANQPSDPKTPAPMFNFMNPAAPSSQTTNTTPGTQTWANPTTLANTPGLPANTFKTPTTSSNQNKPGLATSGFNLTPSTQASAAPAAPTFSIPAATKAGGAASPFGSLKPAMTTPSQTATATGSTAATTQAAATTAGTAPLGTLTLTVGAKPPASPAQPPQQQTPNFQQLEELILNKWTGELYEQEKVFYNQATQINIWDKVINENAEKLTQLHSTMEKVRKQQTKINDDLEVIATHQKDLEACLVPLEKEDLLSVLKGDPNRKNLYSNAKKIDSQIKSMSENLKETIEHINETSRSHDTEDPVIQVGRILNAHMESLRWIDEHTARMQDYFDSLLKVHDDLRRECDLNKH